MAVWLGTVCGCLALSAPLPAQEPKLRATLRGQDGPVTTLAISPDGRILASGGWFISEIKLWDVATGKNTATLNAGTYGVTSLAFSPDGRRLASGGAGNELKLWDVATGKSITLTPFDEEIGCPSSVFAFSPDGKTLASGCSGISEIKLWDVVTGKSTASLKGFGTEPRDDAYGVGGLAFAPGGKILASAALLGPVKLWDVKSGKVTATYRRDVGSVALSPDGKALAAVTDSKNITLWDVATGKERSTFRGDPGEVLSVVFSPDGKTLASVRRSYTIYPGIGIRGLGEIKDELELWDVHAGKERASLKGHTEGVRCVAYSPDGKVLACGCVDNTIRLWEMIPEK
jgi:WD40 repeat protein